MNCKLCSKPLPKDHPEHLEICNQCMSIGPAIAWNTLQSSKIHNYTCPNCGKSHAGYKNGRYISATCRECVRDKREATRLRKLHEGMLVTLDFTPYPWALAWLREHVIGDVAINLVLEIAHKVPADFVKNWLMEKEGESA